MARAVDLVICQDLQSGGFLLLLYQEASPPPQPVGHLHHLKLENGVTEVIRAILVKWEGLLSPHGWEANIAFLEDLPQGILAAYGRWFTVGNSSRIAKMLYGEFGRES